MSEAKEVVERLRKKFTVNHVRQEGARFHVLSWGLCVGRFGEHFGTTWCSDPFCEVNLQSLTDCIHHGIDPAKVIPSVAAKEWLRAHA